MAVQTFPQFLVIDEQGNAAAGATVQAFNLIDTSFTTPLTVTDLNGLPLTLVSNTRGMVQAHRVDASSGVVVYRSGSMPAQPILSLDSVVQAATSADAAATSASASQLAAESAAAAAANVLPAGGAAGNTLILQSTSPRTVVWGTPAGGGGSGGAVTSVAGRAGDVTLVKADVGLALVDNTPDASKPVSTAQAAAIATKAALSHTHAVADVAGLQDALDSKAGVNAAVNASQVNAGTGVIVPARLGTGTAITTKFLRGDGTWQTVSGGGGGAVSSVQGLTGDVVLDAGAVGALPSSYVAPVTSVAGLTGAVTLNKNSVGLGNVENTSDAAKPISTATQAALDLKAADSAVVKLTGNQTVAGVKTFSSSPVVPDGSFTVAKTTGLPTALDDRIPTLSASPVKPTGSWYGSQAQYDALGTKVSTVIYTILEGV